MSLQLGSEEAEHLRQALFTIKNLALGVRASENYIPAMDHMKVMWFTDCRSLSDHLTNPTASEVSDKRLDWPHSPSSRALEDAHRADWKPYLLRLFGIWPNDDLRLDFNRNYGGRWIDQTYEVPATGTADEDWVLEGGVWSMNESIPRKVIGVWDSASFHVALGMRFMQPAFPNGDPPIDTMAQVNRVKKSALLLPLPVSIMPTNTMEELKAMLCEKKHCEDPIERKILKVKVLADGLLVDDDQTLGSSGLLHEELEVTVIYSRNEVEAATAEEIDAEGLLQVNIPSSITEIAESAFDWNNQVLR